MANNLDRIVSVVIDIAAPAIDAANFDNINIVGPLPAASGDLPQVAIYSSLAEVAGAGYITTGENADPIGEAARIAFSQMRRPTHLFVTTMQKAAPYIKDMTIKLITEDNYLTDAVNASPDDMPTDLPWLQLEYSRKAVEALDLVVYKDDVLVFGKELLTTKNPKAFVQIAIGASADPNGDMMNIPAIEQDGDYTVTLTASRGVRTSIISGILSKSGNNFTTSSNIETNVPEMQTPVEALEIAEATNGWYVACAAGIAESEYQAMAEWTEAHTKMFSYTFLSDVDPVSDVFMRSHGWFGRESDEQEIEDVPQSNYYMHVAATVTGLSFPAGSETWANQRVSAVLPSNISTSLEIELIQGNSNVIMRRGGRIITLGGRVRGGEFIDIIRSRDWLQNDMQLRIFNLLIMRSKVPYTDNGIALIENQMRASLLAAQTRGIVAPAEYNLDDESTMPGFVVSVPRAASISATQRASRVLIDCKFTARLAGAIHVVRVDGTLTYEFFIT